uniref:Uncharacterized protein n=1 Tax=Lactuca sativa TaxID=4236 RepID=A0A9R1WQA7_LACSA|nr:hypothetical protein LSAT_V11C100015530 [Lactuca sativa]
MRKGIFVSCSAGNSVPYNSTLSNEAPWVLTVAASTIDRRIRMTIYLGNNKSYGGESLYQPKNFNHKFRPLVYPGKDGKLVDVKGKVVLIGLRCGTKGPRLDWCYFLGLPLFI